MRRSALLLIWSFALAAMHTGARADPSANVIQGTLDSELVFRSIEVGENRSPLVSTAAGLAASSLGFDILDCSQWARRGIPTAVSISITVLGSSIKNARDKLNNAAVWDNAFLGRAKLPFVHSKISGVGNLDLLRAYLSSDFGLTLSNDAPSDSAESSAFGALFHEMGVAAFTKMGPSWLFLRQKEDTLVADVFTPLSGVPVESTPASVVRSALLARQRNTDTKGTHLLLPKPALLRIADFAVLSRAVQKHLPERLSIPTTNSLEKPPRRCKQLREEVAMFGADRVRLTATSTGGSLDLAVDLALSRSKTRTSRLFDTKSPALLRGFIHVPSFAAAVTPGVRWLETKRALSQCHATASLSMTLGGVSLLQKYLASLADLGETSQKLVALIQSVAFELKDFGASRERVRGWVKARFSTQARPSLLGILGDVYGAPHPSGRRDQLSFGAGPLRSSLFEQPDAVTLVVTTDSKEAARVELGERTPAAITLFSSQPLRVAEQLGLALPWQVALSQVKTVLITGVWGDDTFQLAAFIRHTL